MARPITPQSVASRDDLNPDGPVPVGMKRTRSGRIKRKNIIWRMRRYLVTIVALAVLVASAGAFQVWESVDLPTATTRPQASYLCAADIATCTKETSFAEYATPEAGVPVTSDQIPPVLINALVSAEDKDFFNHQGVDPAGIGRAVLHDLKGGRGQQGGSTITQQLVKNLNKRAGTPTMEQKLKETVQAMKLERDAAQTKDGKLEILTTYLNTIFFGRNTTGIDSAVKAYFGSTMTVEKMGLKESAYLAAIIRDPNGADANLSPTNNEGRDPANERAYALTRRRNVLDTMLAEGYITKAERDEVNALGFDYVIQSNEVERGEASKYRDIGATQWREHITNWIGKGKVPGVTKEDLKTRGLRIYTTMDPKLQQAAYEATNHVLPDWTSPIQTGLASVDANGYLRAMVGARDGRSNGWNYATQNKRQVGSSYKPLVLAGYLQADPKNRTIGDQYESPAEYNPRPGDKALTLGVGEHPQQQIDLVDALAESSNTVFGQVLEAYTPPTPFGGPPRNAPAIKVGTDVGLPPEAFNGKDYKDQADVSINLAIGGPVHTSPLYMAYAYSTFMNRGERVGTEPMPISKITAANGEVLYQSSNERRRVLDQRVAEQVDYAMTQVVESKIGTARDNAKVPGQVIAGKTGTVALALTDAERKAKVDKNSDAWFVGFACRYSTAVWLGHEKPIEIGKVEGVANVNGGTLPAKIFSEFMKSEAMAKANEGQPGCRYDRPADSFPATTTTIAPPTTREQTTTTGDRPWWDRRDEGGPTTTRPDWTTWSPPTRPSTTDRSDRTTTTRSNGPGGPSTTTPTTRFRPL